MKILITGVNGFVGQHLLAYLSDQGETELSGITSQPPSECASLQPYPVALYQLDLREPQAVEAILGDLRPDQIVHLAAQAFVGDSLHNPWDTLENNIKIQSNLLESLRRINPACRLLVISSAEVYGKIASEENPVREDQPFRPTSPYAVSKIAQDMLAYQYFLTYNMPTIRSRAFNHIGPGQNTRFALPSFARQIAEAEAGQREPVIRVGNLDVERDFTDVRDVVRAYALLLQHGKPGEVYNICRGEAYRLRDMLERLCQMSYVPVQIEVDPGRLRPADVPRMVGDATRLRQDTGWQPEIALEQTLIDILEHARRNLSS